MSAYSSKLENAPYDTISNAIADDFLYGDTKLDVKDDLQIVM